MSDTKTESKGFQTGHIGLNVNDLDISKKFYQDVFDFEMMGESKEEGKRFAFLGKEQKLILTLWQQSAGRFEKQKPGLHHLSFQVNAIEEVKEFENRLRGLNVHFLYDGIVPHGEGTPSGGIFFEDPDGIRLEIYAKTGAENHTAPTQGAPSCGFF